MRIMSLTQMQVIKTPEMTHTCCVSRHASINLDLCLFFTKPCRTPSDHGWFRDPVRPFTQYDKV